jgi:hypothetical protein
MISRFLIILILFNSLLSSISMAQMAFCATEKPIKTNVETNETNEKNESILHCHSMLDQTQSIDKTTSPCQCASDCHPASSMTPLIIASFSFSLTPSHQTLTYYNPFSTRSITPELHPPLI